MSNKKKNLWKKFFRTTNSRNNFIEATKYLIESYEYKNFSNIQEIGSGVFGKVYRANLNNSHKYLALKSFFNLDNTTVKEIVYEVIIIYLTIYFRL